MYSPRTLQFVAMRSSDAGASRSGATAAVQPSRGERNHKHKDKADQPAPDPTTPARHSEDERNRDNDRH